MSLLCAGLGGLPITLVLKKFSTGVDMTFGNPLLPINFCEGLANRAPFFTPLSTMLPAVLPAPAATFRPGISFSMAELASMLALPCTMMLALFTLNCAFFGPFSIL